MIFVSPTTASAMSLHAGPRSSWVMFAQTTPPNAIVGPIWIEAVTSAQIDVRLGELVRFGAYETFMIGLVETTAPEDSASAIREQYAGKNLHHYWYEPTADLLAYIQHYAQEPIRQLLEQTHPGGLSKGTVSAEEMQQILDVSESTLRRMVKANEIPFMRWGRTLRFVPQDVIASLQRRIYGRR